MQDERFMYLRFVGESQIEMIEKLYLQCDKTYQINCQIRLRIYFIHGCHQHSNKKNATN